MNLTNNLYVTALHNSDTEADIYILNGTTLEVKKGSSHNLPKARHMFAIHGLVYIFGSKGTHAALT